MQIILLHDVEKVGRRGATVNVADGYARNFLFPQGMAVRADTAKTKELEMKLKACSVVTFPSATSSQWVERSKERSAFHSG